MKESLVNRWNSIQHQLYQYVVGKVKDKRDAEDIVQEIFIKASSAAHQLKDHEKFSGWIFRITQNAVMDFYRAKRRHADLMINEFSTQTDPDASFNDCVAFCLLRLMADLPEKYRKALELTEMHNVSQVELARQLNLTHSGAKSRVQRARQMLRERMNQLYIIQSDAYGNIIVCEDRSCNCDASFSEDAVFRENLKTNETDKTHCSPS